MKTSEKLYLAFSQTDAFLSGEDLAHELGISRTSVWKGIQSLEKQGIQFESVRNKGHRLVAGDLLVPSWIEEHSPVKVRLIKHSRSTQGDAKQAAQEGHEGDCLYLAPSQDSAVGRFGRPFFTQTNGGIYMTLHLKVALKPDELPAYTIRTVSVLHQAIEELTGLITSIKWVNDLYFQGKKIAGILTEASGSIETGLITDLFIGLGLNFNINKFPSELEERAGSLFNQDRPPIDRNQLIARIWTLFYEAQQGNLLQRYRKHSLVLGHQVSFQQNQISYQGLAKEITDDGQLLVETETGQILSLQSGEISLSDW